MSYWEDSFDLLKNAAAKQKAGGTAALPKLGAVNYGGGVLPQAAVSRAQALPTLPQKAGEGFAMPVLPRNKATLPRAYTPGTKLSFPAPQTGSGGAKLPKLGAVSYGGGVLPKAAANYGELARDTAQPVQDRYSAELKSIEDRMNTGTLSYEQMIQLGRRRKDLLESRKEEALAQARAHIEKLRAQKEELAAREAELRRQGRTGEAKAAALDRRETNKQLIEALTGPEVTGSALKYLGQEALMGAKGTVANVLDAFSIQAGKAIDERDSSIYGKRADAESAALLEGVDSEKGLFENIGKVIANMAKNRVAGYVNPFEGTGADKPFLDNLAVLYRNMSENAELAAKRGDFGFANAKMAARALGYLKKLIANLVVNRKTAAEQGYSSTEEMEQALTEKLFGNTDWYREQRARLDEEKAKHGGAVQLAGTVTAGAAQMLPSIGVSAMTGSPELGLAMTGLTSYGQSAGEAYRETGDIQAAHRKGIMDAGIEVGTEKLVGGIPFLGDGAADDLLHGLAKKLSPAAQAAVEGFLQSGAGRAAKYLADKGGEGLEEMISEGLSGAVARATTDPEARDATWQEMKEAGLIGVLTAVLLGAGADIASLRQGQSAGAQTLPTPGQNAAGAQGLPSVSYRETGAEALPTTESGGTEYAAEHKKTAGAESADRAKYSIVEDNSGVLRVIADRDRGTQEEKTLARARQLYEKALRDAGKKGTQGSESARFSLEGQPQAVTMEERAASAQNATESAAQMLRDESAGMTRGADFGEDAVRLQNPKGVTGGYNKDIYRVLDDAAGKNRALREHLYEAIERPLNMAKEEYARNVDERMTQYAAQMKDLGIKAGSRESAAVQWFGEGKRRGPDGETEAYTLEQLQREFPQNWENIVAAERIHRRIYDEYVERINDALYKVYPDAEERAMQTVDRAKANAEALREKVTVREKQIDLLKEQLREKKAEAERHRAGTNARTKAEQAAAGKAAELSRRQAELARERARWKKAEEKAAKIRGEYEDGTMLRNKRLTPRKDYFHHYQEMEKGLRGLINIWTSPSEIATSLAGVSEFTKPKSKWASFMQRRGENADYKADAVGGMAKYIPAAEYKISIDPYIAYMRGTIKNIADATAETKNANGLIDLLTDWVGDLAGKTNPIDRPIQKMGGRKLVKTLQWMNARAKANAVVGNLGSALVQIGNIPNATAYVKNPADWGKAGIALAKLDFGRIFGGSRGSDAILEQSPFLRERYLGRATDLLERKNLAQKGTEWMLEIGDKEAAKLTWLAAYQQYQRGGADAGKMMRNYESAVDYADDVTRRSIGGRGIGEVPLSQRSKLVQLAAPFQLEVNNTYQMLKERVGKKDAAGLLSYAVSAWIVNGMLEAISGRRPLFDPIEALMEALKAAGDDDDETNPAQALAGEAVSMIPYAGVVLPTLMGDTESEKIFGEDDPTRYGTGNIGLKAASKLAANMAAGEWEKVLAQDLPEAAATYLTPYGGKQLLRAGEGLQDAGILPQLVTNENGEKEIARAKGSYSSGGLYRFPVDGTAETARNMLLGAFGTESGKEYLKNNEKPYSASATAKIRAAEKAGISPQDFTRAYKWMRNGKQNAYKMGIPYDRAAFLNFAIQKLGVSGDQEQLVRQLLDGVSARSITEDDKRQKASEAGIPEKIFKEAYQRTDELEPVYDLNGKEIKGSREYRIAAMIAKYDLTRAQKTALYEILK